jgi:transposase-like protein
MIMNPTQCPTCGSTHIVFLGYGNRWMCMVCNKSFTEEEYKATLKSKEEDREATLKSTKGGFLVDRQMIKGGGI